MEAKGQRKGPRVYSRESVPGKKRSIHVVNGTLFLPDAEKRKGTFPSGYIPVIEPSLELAPGGVWNVGLACPRICLSWDSSGLGLRLSQLFVN